MLSKSPAKVRHLLARKGRYWARVAVPEAFGPIIRKRKLTEPLGPDLTIAKRKLPAAVALMQDQLATAREQLAVEQPRPALPQRNGRVLSLGNLAKAHFASELAKQDAK